MWKSSTHKRYLQLSDEITKGREEREKTSKGLAVRLSFKGGTNEGSKVTEKGRQ